MTIAEPLQIAIEELSKFPGIGRKTAQRLAIHLLKSKRDDVNKLVKSIIDLKEKLNFCKICFNITEFETCEICTNQKRDNSIICVVEEISDVIAIERTNEYRGLYHVLGGVLSPLNGINQENLKIKELLNRLKDDTVKEIILAINPDTEGETTSLYLAKLIKPLNIQVSRIARGLPIGGDLEFADDATIGRAVQGRIVL
ncbi:MAG: recombination mediator RecR [Ignavibacteria bacterium]|nr:recombination mediator RecR [Ignavibacteria bacterium]MDP3830803.1 recombination mediator RecR [Ignavibacteriaceae bacterium]